MVLKECMGSEKKTSINSDSGKRKVENKNVLWKLFAVVLRGPQCAIEVWAPKNSAYKNRTLVKKKSTWRWRTVLGRYARTGMPSANLFFSFGDEGGEPPPPPIPKNPVLPLRVSFEKEFYSGLFRVHHRLSGMVEQK